MNKLVTLQSWMEDLFSNHIFCPFFVKDWNLHAVRTVAMKKITMLEIRFKLKCIRFKQVDLRNSKSQKFLCNFLSNFWKGWGRVFLVGNVFLDNYLCRRRLNLSWTEAENDVLKQHLKKTNSIKLAPVKKEKNASETSFSSNKPSKKKKQTSLLKTNNIESEERGNNRLVNPILGWGGAIIARMTMDGLAVSAG